MQALHPQVRWVELCPTLSPSAIQQAMSLLEAFGEGRCREATITMSIDGCGKPTRLQDLVALPLPNWQQVAGQILAQAVNAHALSRSAGDGLAQYSLRMTGEHCHPCM